jgi:hypothetical protein
VAILNYTLIYAYLPDAWSKMTALMTDLNALLALATYPAVPQGRFANST